MSIGRVGIYFYESKMLSLNPSVRLVLLMIVLVLFSPIAIDIYLPAMPVMAAEFDVSMISMKDTISFFLISLGLGQLVAGPLADRFGRRPVALSGVIIYVISAFFALIATSFETLLVARFIQGLGACATSVAAFSSVRDTFSGKQSGQMISYLNGAICFVPALAPLLGAWLTVEFGWRANFSFMLIYALVAFILLTFFFKETRPSYTDTQGNLFSFSRYLSILKDPVFLFHASICLLAMGVILAYVTSAPSWLIDELGLSMGTFAFWFGINAGLNIIASMTAPKIMDLIGVRKTLNIGLMVLVFAGTLMMALSTIKSPWAFMLPIFFSSFGFAWVLGSAAGKALEPFGNKAGTAAALLGLFQMSGAGALVSLTQKIGLLEPQLLVLHLLFMLPSLLLLWSSVGKRLCAIDHQS